MSYAIIEHIMLSAPMKVVAEHFGFTVDAVAAAARKTVGRTVWSRRETDNGTGYDRPRSHGREHGGAVDEGRPPVRCQ